MGCTAVSDARWKAWAPRAEFGQPEAPWPHTAFLESRVRFLIVPSVAFAKRSGADASLRHGETGPPIARGDRL